MVDTPKDWKNAHGDRRGAAAFVNGAANAKYSPGVRKGFLTVLAVDRTNQRRPVYSLRCDCGEQFQTGAYLNAIEQCSLCRPKKPLGQPLKYGKKANTNRLYRIWVSMRHRCSPAAKGQSKKHWAAKGIRVCEAWQDFKEFERWSLANGYQDDLSIDRLNVDGHYEPSNCQWVTKGENSRRCRAEYQFVRVRPVEQHVPIEMLWGVC